MEHKKFTEILGLAGDFTAEQAEKFQKALENKDNLDEIYGLIESSFAKHKKCPHCHSENMWRWGHASGLQRYRCKDCQKTYNALTGTPLAHLHKKEEWLAFARTLDDSLSVRKAAKICHISKDTSLHWRHRFLKAGTGKEKPVLKGIVETDETFFLESFKGQTDLPRKARKRGGKAKKRGLSAEQISVLIVRDRHGNHYDVVLENRSLAAVSKALKGVIAPDALMCMDSDPAIMAFAKQEKISYKTIVARKGQHVVDKVIHVQNVNAYTSRLKGWMRRFNGVATKNLPLYLAWWRILDTSTQNTVPKNPIIAALC